MTKPKKFIITLTLIAVLAVVGFRVAYAGRIYPGTNIAGVYLGGLDKQTALAAVTKATTEYQRQLINLTHDRTTVRVPVSKLDLKYDHDAALNQALNYGRQGSFGDQAWAQMRAMVGRGSNFTRLTYSDGRLGDYLTQIDHDANKPVQNASLDYAGDAVRIQPGQTGRRVDLGRLTLAVKDRLSRASDQAIDVPAYDLNPTIDAQSLEPAARQAETYLRSPLQLVHAETKISIDRPQILKWIKLMRQPAFVTTQITNINNLYGASNPVSLELNGEAIGNYVAELAKKYDVAPQNAALTIADGRAVVFQPSRAGQTLDRTQTVDGIKVALNSSGDRMAKLALKTIQPDVREESLNNLGIKEQISRGETTFPGSDAARLVNIRVGAAKYNGYLLKPDEVFSFGAILGDVGPEQGYVPANVILENRVEKQYGGGLCQVSSTAFRAALLAGLMIMERVNHSFVVPYYTAPYGVPGLDAAIYYPISDLKFKNDTGSYILIQTKMQGITLTFDFYGTKTKTGRIRGPQFLSGDGDATKPSKTVFWRDILDLNGNVIKTSAFTSSYASSLDFPKVPTLF